MNSFPIRSGLHSLVLLGFFAPAVQASTSTWIVGTSDWSSSASWTGTNKPPLAADTAAFSNAGISIANLNGTSATITGITVGNTSTTTIENGNATVAALTIGSGGMTISSGAGAVSLGGTGNNAMTVNLSATQPWSNSSSNPFTVSNGITNSATSTPVTLTLSGSGSGSINLNGSISDGTGTSTTAVTISHTGGATTLSGTNTYTGVTTITSGTLILGSSGALGGGGSVAVGGTGILDVNGQSFANAITTSASGATLTNSNTSTTSVLSGTLTNGAAYNVNLTGAGNLTLSGVISVAAGVPANLIKDGAGTLTISGSGNNTKTRLELKTGNAVLAKTGTANALIGNVAGDTALTLDSTAGTLTLGTGGGGDQISDTSTVIVNGGTFDLNGNSESIRGLTGNGGTITNSLANSTSTLTLGGSGSSYSGAINDTGTGKVAVNLVSSTSVYTLSGTSNYSGGTTLSVTGGQTLILGSDKAVGTGAISNSATATIKGSATDARVLSNNIVAGNTLAFGATGAGAGSGALTFGDLSLTASRSVTFNVATTFATYTPGGNFNLNVLGGGSMIVNGSLGAVGTGTISIGNSGGTSTNFVAFAGGVSPSTNSPAITVNNLSVLGTNGTLNRIVGSTAGRFSWAVGGANLGGGFAGYGTATGFGGANNLTVALKDTDGTTTLGLTWGTGTTNIEGTLVLGNALANGSVDLQNGLNVGGTTRTIQIDHSASAGASDYDAKISGVISNSTGTAGVTKTGAGVLVLTAANTYNGTTTISGGSLQLGDGTSGHDGTIASSLSIVNNANLTFNRFGSSSYGGSISGSGSVTKLGVGTQTLTGTHTYTGATTVSAGKLVINGSTSASSIVGVSSGATLAGVGTVGGDTTFAAGSILSAGDSSVGTLTFGKALTLNNSGANSLVFDLGTTSDQVAVGGLLTINHQGFSSFQFNLGSGFGVGTYILFDASSAVTGSLDTSDLSGTLDGYQAALSLDNLNNNLILTVAVVPEPGTWAMMMAGLGLLILVQRRRGRSI